MSWQPQREDRADGDFTGYFDLSVHRPSELPADRETKPAAMMSVGRFCLLKGLEDPVETTWRNASAIVLDA